MGELLRKVLIVPVILAGLGIVFFMLSLLLLVWKGNSRVLGAKLRVGALVIALQAVAVQGAWSGGTCYQREVSTPRVSISESVPESGEIHLNLKETDKITATIRDAYGPFSFKVRRETSRNWETVQSGDLVAVEEPENDSEAASTTNVAITVDQTIVTPGVYELWILWGDLRSSDGDMPLATYPLIVVDE